MPAAQALLEQNAHSETLMDALPALRRLVKSDPSNKAFFLRMLQFWTTFKEEREEREQPEGEVVLRFLVAAYKTAENDDERNALEVMSADWKGFGPLEYLEGCF